MFYLFLIITIFGLKNVQGQIGRFDAYSDTILIINEVGIKDGIEGFISKEYLISTDSLYFYRHPNWKIVEFSLHFQGVELTEISYSNKLTQDMKDWIRNDYNYLAFLGYFKIINEKGELFELNRWMFVITMRSSKKYKEFFERK